MIPRLSPVKALLSALLLCALLPSSPEAAGAQEVRRQAAEDSTRIRILERLQRLAKAPGFDSALVIQDSIRRAEEEAARRGGPVPRAGADSVLAALLELPGYALTEYEGGQADFGAKDRTLVLHAAEGEVARVRREGEEITADSSIYFDERRGMIHTEGQVATFTPQEGDPLTSRSLIFDMNEERGSALDATTRYTEGGNWIVRGDLPSVTPSAAFGTHTSFTSCDLEEPHYHFATDELKIVRGSVLVARPVVLYFADVPVAWLPFIAQSLGDGSASGLLTPRFSVNDIVRSSRGYSRRISNLGFYWAMSDYSDAQLALDWFSGEFLALTGGVRYNWARQFLQGSLNYRQYWREDGGNELAFNTNHSWAIDERTSLRVSGNYASSTSFVRRNSFDPREVTQSIDSNGGWNRRFDFGTLSLSANRRQYLSDDRVEMTLPSLNLSLSPITFFRAPSNRARIWNNITWTGGANYTRRISDKAEQPDSSFTPSLADQSTVNGGFNMGLTLRNLSWRSNVTLSQRATLGFPIVPEVPDPSSSRMERDAYYATLWADELGVSAAEVLRQDSTSSEITWSTSLSYQQRLVGSTTLTPSLRISGNSLRTDESPEASSYVAGPRRVSFGASLKSDIYGFFPGFGSFEQIRHKLTPTFDYSYTPEVTPTQLQRDVFGSRSLQPRNELRIGLTQTFEAKLKEPEDTTATGAESGDAPGIGAGGQTGGGTLQPDTATGPGRQETGRKVNLLSLRTSSVTYDFVEADSTGNWVDGFTTTRLSNQISSDFLRGLSISLDHDLFKEEDTGQGLERKFDPHLSQVNFSFSMGSRTALFGWVGGLLGFDQGPEEEEPEEELEEEEELDPFANATGMEEATIVPGVGGFGDPEVRDQVRGRRSSAQPGQWNANLSYSLHRPRQESAQASQMLQINLKFQPTEAWDVSWRTSYDLEAGAFNDHMLRFSRDLHRWEANFDFRQTATGNWSFRFEVSLTDNRDLKFDYEQRSLLDQGYGRRNYY